MRRRAAAQFLVSNGGSAFTQQFRLLAERSTCGDPTLA
jgi:hypothetical protein